MVFKSDGIFAESPHFSSALWQEQVLEDWLRQNEDGWASPVSSMVSPDRLGQLFPLLSTVPGNMSQTPGVYRMGVTVCYN